MPRPVHLQKFASKSVINKYTALDYVTNGEIYCWSDTLCDRNNLMNGDGKCSECDGPLGQAGYCCRGDGMYTACSDELIEQVKLAQPHDGHHCIYKIDDSANVDTLT